MKTTTYLKGLAIAISFSLTSFVTKAQTAPNATLFSIGLNAGLPSGATYNYMVGGDFRVQKDLTRNIAGMASIGYQELQQGKGTQFADFAYMPAKVGAKFFPLQNLYLTGEVGYALQQRSSNVNGFIWSPGIGYNFANGIDLGLRYEGSQRFGVSAGITSFRIGYNINFSDFRKKF